MARSISVITATLNRREQLSRAIASVVGQGLWDVEHIIVDGQSTDGTLDMLRHFQHLVVISEADKNLFEAWNKGLQRARGDIVCILNSDDEIPSGAFNRVRAALALDPQLDLVSGAVELRQQLPQGNGNVRIIDAPAILALREQDIGPGIPITNGRYMTRRLMERVGLFDERYRLVSDRDYLLRVLLTRPRNICISEPLYSYGIHAGSLTLSGPGATEKLAHESLLAAGNGLAEAKSTLVRDAYARWHAWALAYWVGLQARRGRLGVAAASLAAGTDRDPWWLMRLPGPVVRHVRERPWRAGRIMEARQ